MNIFTRAKAAIAAATMALALAAPGSASADTKVVVGYQQIVGPFISAIADGSFDKALAAEGYTVDWRQFASAGDISVALASGNVAVGVIGSTGATASVTRGVDAQLFWILDNIGKSEALIARNGSGIEKPEDLKGKKVAVPFVSTSHFHLLVALEKVWKINPRDVTILNLTPPQIVAAWERGDIDAAYVWPPALSKIEKTGKEIINSGEVGKASVPTFDAIMVGKSFGKDNPKFMAAFTKVLAKAYADFKKNGANWTVDSPEVKGNVKLIGGTPQDIVEASKLLEYPTVEEQVSKAWLGGGAEGGAVRAFAASADFLKAQKQIDSVLPDYTPFVNASFAEEAAKSQ
ncbi:MAG: taurine ABC transporter substrate-binding protein [Rhizobiales bacterium 65-79]|jgi:taurine transport system substrate-binding protein|nr:taurine ABC transporter substrate-binding protein [Hyphomicrobiales bacterium]OJU02392.1 MAG: taurine ABC transporter substrate-binding protein [Rhizobiales bacterium 65-79]